MVTYTMDWVSEPAFEGFNVTSVPGALAEDFLAWEERPWPVDAGVPAPIAALLGVAFCRCGELLFFGNGRDHPDATVESVSRTRVVPVGVGVLSRLAGMIWRNRIASWTTDPSIATALFDMPFYPWSSQGNSALLLHPGVEPDELPILAGHLWRRRHNAFPGGAVVALIQPGNDGIFAHLAWFDRVARTKFRAAVEDGVATLGIALGDGVGTFYRHAGNQK